MTVEYDTKCMACASYQNSALGWNIPEEYLSSTISQRPNTGTPTTGKTPISAPDMTNVLNVHTRNGGECVVFTIHFFKSGEALTSALAREDLLEIMQRAFWEKPSTARKYLSLMYVLISGPVRKPMVTEVSPEQYREIKTPELSQQSRHWAAFGNASMTGPPTEDELWATVLFGMSNNKEGFNIRVNNKICIPSKWAR